MILIAGFAVFGAITYSCFINKVWREATRSLDARDVPADMTMD